MGQAKRIRKIGRKITFLRLWGNAIWKFVSTLNSLAMHPTKFIYRFSTSCSIWSGTRYGKAHFKSPKKENLHYTLYWPSRMIFVWVIELLILHWLTRKRTSFAIFIPQYSLFKTWVPLRFHPRSPALKNIKLITNPSLLPKLDRFWLVWSWVNYF